MTDKQPDALFYADKLEKVFGLDDYAIEMRRLHEVNAEFVRLNSELVEALWRLTKLYDAIVAFRGPSRIIAEAALAKAEGK